MRPSVAVMTSAVAERSLSCAALMVSSVSASMAVFLRFSVSHGSVSEWVKPGGAKERSNLGDVRHRVI